MAKATANAIAIFRSDVEGLGVGPEGEELVGFTFRAGDQFPAVEGRPVEIIEGKGERFDVPRKDVEIVHLGRASSLATPN